MKSERNLKILAIVAIVLAVGGLSIGFASFAQVLSIENTAATVSPANFSVIFTNLQPAVTTGQAVVVSEGTLSPESTVIDGIDVTLLNPLDSFSYTFDISNTGTMPAKLSSITKAGIDSLELSCVGSGADAATDQTNVCDSLEYTLVYADPGEAWDGLAVGVNDTLAVGEAKTVELKLVYNPADSSLLPKEAVSIGNLDIALNYTQDR